MSRVEYVISACLCGLPVRYDGKAKPVPSPVRALLEAGRALPVCPECLGGLPTPRPPAERCGSCVINCIGEDVTDFYVAGAQRVLTICRENNIRKAILKENSPSCGCRRVHDGTFTGGMVAGQGVTAALLANRGIAVYSEEDLSNLDTSG